MGLLLKNERLAHKIYAPETYLIKNISSLRAINAHHPVHLEFVATHAKARRPKGLAYRHKDVAAFGQCIKQSPGMRFVICRDGQANARKTHWLGAHAV